MPSSMLRYAVVLLLLLTVKGQAQTRRPNIIVFLVDDMGWMDTAVPFGDSSMPLNTIYSTPAMEQLAREGMKFTNAYATPVCTPTRVSMLSGMSAAHHRVTNWTSPAKNNSSDAKDDQLLPVDWNSNGMSPVAGIPHTIHATPFPQLLKESGYYTIHVGKAHWGSMGTPGANPYNLGFMVNIAGHAAGHPQSYRGTDNYGNQPGKASAQAVPDLEEYFGTDTFLTEALTQEAIKAIATPIRNKQPFYLNMAHYAVHAPIQADPRFFQKYIDKGLDSIEARYASLVEGMDKSLGDILAYLQKTKADQHTIIIFMSDNGGLSLVPPRGGKAHTQNLPLRAGKGSVYEGGIREPMLVKWPGVARPGSVSTQPLIIEDFFPSILEMAGIKKYTTVQQVDGKSFVPAIKKTASLPGDRLLVWHYPNKWQQQGGPGINYFSAARYGKWKLVYNMLSGKNELYDLSADIGEQQDLSASQPDKVKELAQLLTSRLKKLNAQMPVWKATQQPVAWPDGSR